MSTTYPNRIRALTYFTMADEGVSGYEVGPGAVIDITPNVFENTRDINGHSWLTLTKEEQTALYGTPRFEVIEENES